MSTSPNELKFSNLDNAIEMAMNRLGQRSPEAVAEEDRKDQVKRDLGQRDYEMARARRQEHLRTALRNANVQGAESKPQFPVTAVTGIRRSGLRTGMDLFAKLLAIAAGAGVTWLAVTVANPQLVAVPVPVVSSPVAVPESASREIVETSIAAPAPQPDDEELARDLVEKWRSAWAGRDVDAYLACYTANFIPANGQSRDAWAEGRRKNISGRSSIIVATHELAIDRLDAQRMVARFSQDYASGTHLEIARPKTLLLVRGDAGWQIAGEWQGKPPVGALGALGAE